MKKLILLNVLLLLLFILPVTAQIEKEITSYVDSTEMMVINGRKMIIVKLTEKDYSKINETYQYLENKTLDKENTPFDYTEYLYINLLMGDWNTLTDFIKEYNESENIVPYPNEDQLKDVLIVRVIESSDSLILKSQNAAIDEDAKSVIQLLIHLTRNDTPDPKYYSLLNEHDRKFKRSAYKDFTKYYLPEPRIKTAYSFSLGSGMVFPTGKLEESFSQRPTFNASIDVNYKNVFGSFNFLAAGLKLDVPFILDLGDEKINFEKDDIFNYQDFGIKIGYFFIRSNRFHLGPYASLNGIILKSTNYDFLERIFQRSENGEDSEYQIINSFSCGPGIHTEIKLFESHKLNKNSNTINRYVSLKADAGYNYITDHDIKYFKGNTCYYSVSLVFGDGIF